MSHKKFTVALTLFAILFAVGLGEIVLRYAGFGRPIAYDFDPKVLWTLEPNQKAFSPTSQVLYEINSDGLRDSEISPVKQPDELRILMLGDSVTFGLGVALADTVPERLETLLGDMNQFESVAVINAGVSGYSTRQQRIFLERAGLAYEPDMVVLGFVHNDLITAGAWNELEKEADSASAGKKSNLWRQRSAWIHLLGGLYDRLARDDGAQALNYLPTSSDGSAWDFTLGEIARISQLLSASDIPFMIMVYPLREDVAAGAPRDIARLKALADDLQVEFLDLYPVLAENGDQAMFQDSVHTTALANDLVARATARRLVSEVLAGQQDGNQLFTPLGPPDTSLASRSGD